MTFRVTYNV